MKTEGSLSDKMVHILNEKGEKTSFTYISTQNVKEAVKKLKEELCSCGDCDIGVMKCKSCEEIDKIFGDKICGVGK